jgi:molybdenum cofactor synthesis domain-containing protein
MRPFTSTIPFHDALKRLLEAAEPIEGIEEVPLLKADGRVAAADVVAEADVPPFNRAAMDGYAVIAADTSAASAGSPVTLTCVERVFTGEVPARPLRAGECTEIATGAPMPDGADAVVMVEETERDTPDAERVRIRSGVAAGQNLGRRGADIGAGQTVVAAGQVLTPGRIGALAATGVSSVAVYRRPSVAILTTGNEIAPPGQPLAPGQVYNVNRFTLEAVVRRHGGVATAMPTVPDSIDALSEAVEAARAHHLMVFSGGSSVGDRDLVIDVLEQLGEVIFHGVAVKPGKPTAFGRIGRTPALGMPGYPTSCLSNAYMLLVPFLRKMARLPEWRPTRVELPLARRVVSTAARHQFYTVRTVDGRAEPAFKASGDITSMANADGYIEIPVDVQAVEAGTRVTVTLFE